MVQEHKYPSWHQLYEKKSALKNWTCVTYKAYFQLTEADFPNFCSMLLKFIYNLKIFTDIRNTPLLLSNHLSLWMRSAQRIRSCRPEGTEWTFVAFGRGCWQLCTLEDLTVPQECRATVLHSACHLITISLCCLCKLFCANTWAHQSSWNKREWTSNHSNQQAEWGKTRPERSWTVRQFSCWVTEKEICCCEMLIRPET